MRINASSNTRMFIFTSEPKWTDLWGCQWRPVWRVLVSGFQLAWRGGFDLYEHRAEGASPGYNAVRSGFAMWAAEACVSGQFN